MEVKCNRAALSEAVQLASSIVPSRSPKPILQCANIRAVKEENILTISATDGEITVKSIVPQVQIVRPGATVVPADRIAAILREATDEMVDLRVSETTCEVVTQDSCFHIYGHEPGDFPEIVAVTDLLPLKIKAKVLKYLTRMSVFAAARETSRYAINGVLWEQHGKKLQLVATDGRRLAKVEGELLDSEKQEEQMVIIQVKAMLLLERIIHDPEEIVEIGFTGNQVRVRTVQAELVSNLVQGKFPKYSDVIPSGGERKVQLDVETFHSAVRRAALLTNEHSKGIRLAFTEGQLCLSSSTPEAGDAEVTMKARYEGSPFEIGFNPQYLIDMLRIVEQPEILCEFTDGTKPGLLRAGKDFLYVVMPVTG